MASRPKTHDLIACSLHSYDRHGVAYGERDGWRVEASGGFVGERVRGRISHVAKQSRRLFIQRPEVIVPHPERRQAPCPQQRHCGGCSWMQLREPAQQLHKQRQLSDSHQLEVEPLVAQPGGSREYRWSSKRVVGGSVGRLCFGSYRRGTHQLADMRGCLVDHPDITRCLDELLSHANRAAIVPYDEADKSGTLRYLLLKTNGAGQVLLTLVCTEASDAISQLARGLKRPAGVFLSIQGGLGNTLRGHALRHVCGATELPVTLCGIDVTMGPLGFLQPNPLMAERCYVQLVKGLSGTVAYDLYAGPGVTSAMLARTFTKIYACDTFVEGAPAAPVTVSTAEDFLDKALSGGLPFPDAIICNPPRAGLSARVCEQLKQLSEMRPSDSQPGDSQPGKQQPLALHIMSCDPTSFSRDRDRLSSHFNLILTRAFDTLPQTPHLELVGHFVASGRT